jgi:hypothetical protein
MRAATNRGRLRRRAGRGPRPGRIACVRMRPCAQESSVQKWKADPRGGERS